MNSTSSANSLRPFSLIFFTSMALMMFEVNLIRLFSVLMYHHLAFFVLAISLFGIGMGGLYAHLLREYYIQKEKPTQWVIILPSLLIVSILLALVVLIYAPVSGTAATDQIPRIRWIFLVFIICALPFALGSMYISSIFAANPERANTLYFFDLFGGSTGCLFTLFSLQSFGALNGTVLVASILFIPVFLYIKDILQRKWTLGIALFSALIFVVLMITALSGHLSLRGERYANLLYKKWNYYSFITVQDAPPWRGWRPSHNYTGPVPAHKRIRQDGRAPAFIVNFDGDFSKVEYLKWDFTALPFYVAEPKKILIIGAGGGRDILAAKLFGVPEVRAVELNPNIAGAMRNEFRAYSGGVYTLDGVDVVVENARTFVGRDTEKYDLIFTSLTDTQTANSQGAQILSENHIYTTQAFEAYWDRLSDNGVCSIVTGLAEDLIRHVSTVSQALENKGIPNPEKHLIAIMTEEYGSISRGLFLAVSKKPVDNHLLSNAINASSKLGYTLMWPQQDMNSEWSTLIGALANPQTRSETIKSLTNDFSPIDDDRPYLFYNTKPRTFIKALMQPLSILRPSTSRPEFSGNTQVFYLLLQLFLVIGFCVFLLMLTPLFIFRHKELQTSTGLKIRFLVIFFMLGLGYMLVEIALLQHFFLLLGNPTLAFAVVLCVMLLGTGIGSFIAKSFSASSTLKLIAYISIIIVGIQLFVLLSMPWIHQSIDSLNITARLAVVCILILLLTLPMGFVFPSAIRFVNYKRLDITCWAWGMNGLGSVFGSVGATVLSMNFGIRITFLAGVFCYAIVFLISLIVFVRKQSPDPIESC